MFHQQQPHGISQIINLFRDSSKKIKSYNLSTIRKLLFNVKIDGQDKAEQDLKQICCYINTLFLLNFLHTNLFLKECYHSPADEKVISVIFNAYQIVFLESFISHCEKKGKLLQQLLGELKQMRMKLWSNLQVMRISKSDIENLYTLHNFMQEPNQRERYFQIVYCVYGNTGFYVTEIKKLFQVKFLNSLYTALGLLSDKEQILSVKQKIQSLKLQIVYIRCIVKVPDKNKLKKQTGKSKIYKIFDYEGFQTLLRYFNNLVIQDKDTDKKYCHEFFKSQQMEAIVEDQLENAQSDKYLINIKPPKIG